MKKCDKINVQRISLEPYVVMNSMRVYMDVLAFCGEGNLFNLRVFSEKNMWSLLDGVPKIGLMSPIQRMLIEGEVKKFTRQWSNESLSNIIYNGIKEKLINYDDVDDFIREYETNFGSASVDIGTVVHGIRSKSNYIGSKCMEVIKT